MSLDQMIGAIRAAGSDAGDGDADADLATATRLRVARSLETRARSRHQLVGVATTIAILLVGTVSWALATGQIEGLWSPPLAPWIAPEPPPEPPAPPPRPRPPAHRRQAAAVEPRPSPSPEEVAPPAPVPAPPPAPSPVVAPPPVAAPAPRPPRRDVAPPVVPASSAPIEVLYRRAHELHFHGSDPAAALAAWDAYLAAEPDGRFSVEARYNRALALVRLARYAEARAALVPFARGEVAPEGYRQTEAEQLVERLAQLHDR